MSRLAGRQFGRVAARQLRSLGVGTSTASDWVKASYLHPELPGVYAVGHRSESVESKLAAALLYAGPGAMLSHGTAAWCLGLLDNPPTIHEISTPRRPMRQKGLRIHTRRELPRIWRRRLPTTTVAQTLLDFASVASSADRVRFVLANADYHGFLDVGAIEALLCQGRPGTASLRAALALHQPRLAQTRSVLERAFIELCESHALPLPEVNVYVEGWLVDAVWWDQRVVVELDGLNAHRTPAQLERDHQRDLALRAAGFTVVRYTYRQLTEHGAAIAAELWALLSLPVPLAGRGSR